MDIEVDIPQTRNHADALLALHGHPQRLKFALIDGSHRAASDPVVLGALPSFEGKELHGVFEFQYSYREADGLITVCGTDFQAEGSMSLHTTPEGTDETCVYRAAGGGFVHEDQGGANLNWNRGHAVRAARDLLRTMARSANDALLEALRHQGLTVQVRTPPPVTPEGEPPALLVYRNGVFKGVHDPNGALDPDDSLHTIESVWGGQVTFTYSEKFANVIGSTNDPKIAGLKWIQLWARQFGVYPNVCTSYYYNGFPCGPTLVGGHVIVGTTAHTMPKGSNSVYIFPICVQHNNNDNVYMAALKYLQGVWLKNYMGH